MVKLLRLNASQFKRLKFDRPLEFREGVTLITGLNEMGKSSVLDAILYALFGRVIRPPGRAKNVDIVAYNEQEATVWLEFEVGAHRFRVVRRVHRTKPSRARLDEVLPNGDLKPLATEARKVTEEVEKLLGGITFDELVSSTVVAQKDLNRLIQQRSDDRRKVINVFLNLDSFNVVLEDLHEERKELEGTGLARPGKLNIEQERLHTLEKELQEFQRREKEIISLTGENAKLTGELEALQTKYVTAKRLQEVLAAYDGVTRRRKELEAQLRIKRHTLETHQNEIANLEQQIQTATRQLEAYAGLNEAEATLTQLPPMLEDIRGLQAKLRDEVAHQNRLEEEVANLQSALAGFDPQALQKLRAGSRKTKPYAAGVILAFLSAFVAYVVALPAVAALLGATGVILAVVLGISVARVSRLAALEGLLGRAELLEGKRKDLEQAKKTVDLVQTQKAALETEILRRCESVSRYAPLLQEQRQKGVLSVAEAMLEEVSQERKTADALSSSLNTLRNQLEGAAQRLDVPSLQADMAQLEQNLATVLLPSLPDGVEFSIELLQKTVEEQEALGRQISSAETQVVANTQRIEENQRFVLEQGDLGTHVEAQQTLVHGLRRRSWIVRNAIEAVEKTAEALRNRVRPGVEQYMAHILPAITAGRYRAVRLDDDYNLQVWDPEAGEFRAKEVFSGGTEDQFLLAMRLAFALALLPEVKGRKPEFLFLDEPLGSADEVRRSGILEYLTTGLAESFKQIFLISHVAGLEEEIPNVVRLEDGRVGGV